MDCYDMLKFLYKIGEDSESAWSGIELKSRIFESLFKAI